MKITVEVNGRARKATLPYECAEFVIVDDVDCPRCGKPLAVQSGQPRVDHDRYRALAWCVVCKAKIGEMVVVVDTIFGIEEDERVLNARCRVY